jgi:hypothetical protein
MSDRLNPGETLSHGDHRTSQNGRFVVVMQDDGNLVLYEHDKFDRYNPRWTTKTEGTDVNRAVMQTDGNLVLYRTDNTRAWESETFGEGIYLIVQNDGNMVLYKRGMHDWTATPVWATNTVAA